MSNRRIALSPEFQRLCGSTSSSLSLGSQRDKTKDKKGPFVGTMHRQSRKRSERRRLKGESMPYWAIYAIALVLAAALMVFALI
jgi:hypothetical protein